MRKQKLSKDGEIILQIITKTDVNPKEQDPWQEEMIHLCENNPGGKVVQTETTGKVRASNGNADRNRK